MNYMKSTRNIFLLVMNNDTNLQIMKGLGLKRISTLWMYLSRMYSIYSYCKCRMLQDKTYQVVKIGHTLSDLQKLLFGVPQGFVLGPLLFSLISH